MNNKRKEFYSRIGGLEAAVKYLSRGAGKAGRIQRDAYLKAIEDVKAIMERSSLLDDGAPKALSTSSKILSLATDVEEREKVREAL